MQVGIYEAKPKLSRLVKKAEAGEEVVLTRRGKPVARFVTFAAAARAGRRALLREIMALARRARIRRRCASAKSWPKAATERPS